VSALTYTVKIFVEDVAALDGSSPIPSSIVPVVDPVTGIRTVTIPAGNPFGKLDIGELVSSTYQKTNMAVTSLSVVSGAPHSAGSFVGIETLPGLGAAPAKTRQLLDLNSPDDSGIFEQVGLIFQQGQSITFNTLADGATGPHVIQMTVVVLDSECGTLLGQIITGPGGGGGGGTVTNGANVGVGAPVFKILNGTILEFRRITGLGGITVVQNGDSIEVSGNAGLPWQLNGGVPFSSNVVANLFETVAYDGTAPGGPFTISAPLAPADNDVFQVKEVRGGLGIGVTLSGNGALIENYFGVGVASFPLLVPRASLTYQYYAIDGVWRLV